MIKLAALDPYGHWNYKPVPEDMWAFLSRFRRGSDDGRTADGIEPLNGGDVSNGER